MGAPLVELRGLEARYGRRVALAGVDLVLDSGQIVGIVGPDGAGKTTLLRVLAGLLEVRATRARVLGVDLTGDVTAMKEQIGYVPQTFGLERALSVGENLRFTARLHRIDEAEFARRREALLGRTGLAPFADRPAGKLSGGMKQKLAVANALLPRPRLLVLDEPTAGVDVVARAELWAMLTESRGETLVVISTSYLDEAAACDRLVYLDRGRVVASGTPAELRAAAGIEVYRAWGADARGIARAARGLPYVRDTHATGRYARVEVAADRSPGAARVLDDLGRLGGHEVDLAEPLATDMEATLRALARET